MRRAYSVSGAPWAISTTFAPLATYIEHTILKNETGFLRGENNLLAQEMTKKVFFFVFFRVLDRTMRNPFFGIKRVGLPFLERIQLQNGILPSY